jgi:predicted O-linked N-acetylglucosamine transferase (SPINDLY family)
MNPQISYLLNLSMQHIQLNRLDEAERSLGQILKMQPKNPDALCFLSVVAAYKSNFKEAIKWIDKSIEAGSKNPIAYNNRGNVLKELGRHTEALSSYEKALALAPNYEEAYSNKGNVLQDLKRYQDAVMSYDAAISLAPNYAEAYNNKGNALQKLGQIEASLACYEQALSIKPEYAEAWFNQGNAFHNLRLKKEAVESYDRAISIKPDYAEAWNGAGLTFFEANIPKQALVCHEKAISIKPDLDEAWIYAGLVHQELKNFTKSIECQEVAISLNAGIKYSLGFLIGAKAAICQWDGLESLIQEVKHKIKYNQQLIVPFTVLSVTDSPKLHLQVAQNFIADKHPSKNTPLVEGKKKHNKIRLGYFSADFKEHPVSFLTAELFEMHDRNSFEIFAFSLKSAPEGDQMRARLIHAFDQFIDVSEKSNLAIVQTVRDLEIDIAIDLGGHTQHGPMEIFSYRAAPIQVNYLGYPGTSGAEYMDYILADQTLIPESGRQFYTEKVAYLPDTYMVDDSTRALSTRKFTRAELGLPDNKIVFCCFNNGYKFNQKIVDSWVKILIKVEQSVLWITDNNGIFKENLLKEFTKLGIDSSRIIFAKRLDSMGEHLARYEVADLFLDTHPYNAHTTAVDALKAGIPLITYIGEAFAGRVAASLLNAVGMPELIANTFEQYESMAIDLALHPDKLRSLKEKLSKNRYSTALFNTKLFTKNLEALYSEMYQRYLGDIPVDHLII